MKPEHNNYPEYFKTYINLVESSNISLSLTDNKALVINFFKTIPEEKIDFAYAPGKWTVKQILNHITDTERVMAYRALRFARNDSQMNLSFDENAFAANADLSNITMKELLQEFENVRSGNALMFSHFTNEALLRQGNMKLGKISVLALGYVMCGHALHHMKVIKEKYL